jgi:hypothetical protein
MGSIVFFKENCNATSGIRLAVVGYGKWNATATGALLA